MEISTPALSPLAGVWLSLFLDYTVGTWKGLEIHLAEQGKKRNSSVPHV